MADSELGFQKIYNTFHPKIYRYLTRLVGSYEAEDLTQEAFMKVHRALKSFRGESQLSTWIYSIATNVAMDRLRSPSFQQMVQKQVLEDDTPEAENHALRIEQRPSSPDQELIQKEMNACVRRFIEALPENYRTVLVLSELEELKNHEIVQIMDITLNTVKIRLHRARARLKKALEVGCHFYRDERNELACDLKSALEGFRKET